MASSSNAGLAAVLVIGAGAAMVWKYWPAKPQITSITPDINVTPGRLPDVQPGEAFDLYKLIAPEAFDQEAAMSAMQDSLATVL